MPKRSILRWLASAAAAAVVGLILSALSFGWYIGEALQPNLSLSPEGTTIVGAPFAPTALAAAVVVASFASILIAGVAVGVFYLLGRRLAPAVLVAVCGPVASFVLQAFATASDALDGSRGEVYLGVAPVAIAGRSLITLAPAIVGAGVLLVLNRRANRLVADGSD